MPKLLNFRDIHTAATLAAMSVLDGVCSESRKAAAARRCAAIHVALRGSKRAELDGHSSVSGLDLDSRRLEIDFLTGVYREMLYTVGEYRGETWSPVIQIKGRQHLDDAIRAGRGAVLWAFPCTYGGLVTKKALHAAGFEGSKR